MELDLRFQTQLYLGLHERELQKWLKKFSARVNTAIDIGAGVGEYTLYFLMKSQINRVIAFEPSEKSLAMLLTNLELNQLAHDPRLKLFTKFVGYADGENECTLDSILPLISTPCLIKMDVDGGEVNILQGATRLLDLPELYWIIEVHSQELEERCVQLFDLKGFVITIVPNAWWRRFIPEFRPIPHNRWLIASRNREPVKKIGESEINYISK